MALPTTIRAALDRLYDRITDARDGMVWEKFSYAGKPWKLKVYWSRDNGRLTVEIRLEERLI